MKELMLDAFLFETTQLTEQLEELIIRDEKKKAFSQDAINEIFRIMHTIKGSSAMMMYGEISRLAHSMEDLFYYLREEKPKAIDFTTLTDLILTCIDTIKCELGKIGNGQEADGNSEELINQITSYLDLIKNKRSEEKKHYQALLFFDEGCGMENIRAFSMVLMLQKVADNITHYPQNVTDDPSSAEVIQKEGFSICFTSGECYEEVYQILSSDPFIKTLDLVLREEETASGENNSFTNTQENQVEEASACQKAKAQTLSNHQNMICVSVSKLDLLMNLVGEMVIAEAMVIENTDLKGLYLENFSKAARHLNKITNEIQDTVMSIRMVPLAATFHKMTRIVRDMCKKLDKSAELNIIGEETEVDKNIIEHISDPLMHLVRNALDHGIEMPEVRRSVGKEPKGTITIEAKNSGGDVWIIVKDDGKGIDKNKILEKAKRQNLLMKKPEEMTDREICNLILLPGFSTKTEVSEYSGRGVGMDVVSKKIEEIGGSVFLDSESGKGSTFTLKIPLTLAIIDGMNIQVGTSNYTLPTAAVREFFKVTRNQIVIDPAGKEMIMVRGECYPICRLHRYFGVKSGNEDLEQGIMIMIEQEESAVCLFADQLIGQQQVVVKALPEYITRTKKMKGLTGCTLLGDGSISLIIDVTSLLNQ